MAPKDLIGKPAPDFTITSTTGEPFTFSSVLNQGTPVALFFFPQAGTSVCDAEACAFEASFPRIESSDGVTVVGVSYGTPEELKVWKEKHKLSYPVLSDASRTAQKQYQLSKVLFGASEARATFFIDGTGTVKGVLDGTLALLSAKKHVEFISKWVADTKK